MPPLRLLEHALAIGDGAGERAAHVAEQLRLEQRLGDRAAVDRRRTARARARLCAWIARATSSLPVPLSPMISTGAAESAAWAICL